MNEVNKTLYIPLYGKAYVSREGVILCDRSAERIWERAGFKLSGKSASKWLAYYMGMRARVFDNWVTGKIGENSDATVLHIGAGLDGRIERVGREALWYDIDFPDVISERKKYFSENGKYTMLAADVREDGWLKSISGESAIVIIEGVSMYLTPDELEKLLRGIYDRFDKVCLLMDCYTVFAAKMSKIKNPINDVGVTRVYGIDDPASFEKAGLKYIGERDMTPEHLIDELTGIEKTIFKKLYGGRMSKKLYRLYEYEKKPIIS